MADTVMLASPAFVHMAMDGKDITIMDADLNFSISNGSKYKRALGGGGNDEYIINKGTEISTKSDITIKVVQSPGNKKVEESLQHLKDSVKTVTKEIDPEKYINNFVFVVSNTDKQSIIQVSFKGFVKEITTVTPEKGYTVSHAQIVMYDAATLQFLT